MQRSFNQFVLTVSLLLLGPSALSAQREVVTGVVRDSHGTPQMGVLVELLGSGAAASALTDLSGRYKMSDLLPGVYQMRMTAALSMPVLSRRIRVSRGINPVINLMITGMFDDTALMASGRLRSGENVEDWKWMLRSPANRPMLRLVDAGFGMLEEGQRHGETHAGLSFADTRGVYGGSEEQVTTSFAHRNVDGTRESRFTAAAGSSSNQRGELPLLASATFEGGKGSSAKHRISARIKTYPQLRTGTGGIPSELSLSSAERMELGDFASIEAGTQTQLLRAGSSIVVTRPFLGIASRPIGGWTLSYKLATTPDVAAYEDVGSDDTAVPTIAASRTGRILSSSGMHQEIRLRRALGSGKVHISVHHDVQQRSPLVGTLLAVSSAAPVVSLSPFAGMPELSVDTTNDTFRTLAGHYTADGCSVLFMVPVGDDLRLSGGYLNSVGVTLGSGSDLLISRPLMKRAQGLLFSVEARVPKAGTRVSTSYRWQPASIVSVLSPYEVKEISPYLGIHLRQPVGHAAAGAGDVELTVDGTNLLGEGYQRVPLSMQNALLTSALRELRLGLAFSF